MTSMMHPSRLFVTIGCFVILSVTRAAAADWPEGYIVYEESKSPDEKYAILIPSREAAENDESVGETNYLADLQKHQLTGKIRDADYFENQNHRGLQVVWAPDSTWCIVEYDGRFGFGTISILELKAPGFVQTDIGKHGDLRETNGNAVVDLILRGRACRVVQRNPGIDISAEVDRIQKQKKNHWQHQSCFNQRRPLTGAWRPRFKPPRTCASFTHNFPLTANFPLARARPAPAMPA